MKSKSLVLMLEDDPDDRFITESILNELGNDISIKFLQSSTDLFSFLNTRQKPNLIIVDFNSIPENAVQILKQLKSNNIYKAIPVVVLSDSSSSEYVSECYYNGANSCITKPVSIEATTYKIDTFFKYWLTTAEI